MRVRSVLVVIVIMLAACSGDDADGGASGPSTTETPDTAGAATTTTDGAEGPVVTEAATTTTIAEGGGPTVTEVETTSTTTTTLADPGAGMDGTWIAELSHIAVAGPCPSTPTQRGPVTFERDGDQFILIFGPDFDCDPAEACAFSGTVDGDVLTGANAGAADSQGGIYESSFIVTWDGADHIEGTGRSTYTNAGVVCTWDTRLVMDRE